MANLKGKTTKGGDEETLNINANLVGDKKKSKKKDKKTKGGSKSKDKKKKSKTTKGGD